MSNKTSFKVLQANLNRSAPATESALQMAIELKIDLLVIQEPRILHQSIPEGNYSNARSIAHPSFSQILPASLEFRPRTLVYVAKSFKPLVTISSSSPKDSDLLVIDIIEGQSKIQLLNIYNESDQSTQLHPLKTLERCLYTRTIEPCSILLGDFNMHHPWWDPLAIASPAATQLVNWLEDNGLALLNSPGTGTFFRPHMARETVLDLTLATSSIANRIEDWQIIPDLGSDHSGVLFTVTRSSTSPELFQGSELPKFNTKLANWERFSELLISEIAKCPSLNSVKVAKPTKVAEISLQVLQNQEPESAQLLDLAAIELTTAITNAARASIPVHRPGAKPKPWWNPKLKELRKAMLREHRSRAQSGQIQAYLAARNSYFLAIKRAKRDHWNQFLEKEDPVSIYKAMAYTKEYQSDRLPPITGNELFQDKCSVLREALFPVPPSASDLEWSTYRPGNWKWPGLTRLELENACSAKIKGKTPGPDQINQDIVRYAYEAIPDIFFRLYSNLVDIGYHPKCWKQATGAVLKKPSKPDYSIPKAYRVISLLNCLGKVSERILAQRLGYLAETTPLLHPSQIGGRLQKSAIDAALILTNEVEQNRIAKHKTSTLFLDIKGAFDHVAKNQLLAILQKLRMPTGLVAWVASFLANRQLRLSFDGQLEGFSEIDTGIPQGSPISPILFLIYIRDLFPRLSSSIRVISYIDDIALVTSSTSLKKNISILEREVAKLQGLATQSAIQFDLAKTELIHFTLAKEAKTTSLRLPDGEIVQPKELVRWLGIWFDPNLTFKQHVAIRTSQARSAFQRLSRLANSELGLSPFAIRQLYLACVASVADYGSPIWWRGQAQFKRPLQALQNLAMRKILGVFRTAPTRPMEVEAALMPPEIRLDATVRKYALRASKLAPHHPISEELRLPQSDLLDPLDSASGKIKPPTQLERIRSSIQGLAELDELETIEHFKYPPWNRTIPYSVSISSLPKDEAATEHLASLELGPSQYAIYSDASTMLDSTGVGVGVAIFGYKSPSPLYRKRLNLGPNQLVYNGELEGVTQAIELASQLAQPGQKFKVFSDNQASLNRLQSPTDAPGQACQIRSSLATEVANRKGATIELHWVPGHADIPGNELADSLAKSASHLAPDSLDTSYAHLGSQIRKQQSDSWLGLLENQRISNNLASYSRKYPWNPRFKIQLPKTSRKLASAFFQLKLGHGYLKSYLYRLGHSTSNRCSCGQIETAEHLLLSCKKLSEARRRLQDEHRGARLNLRLLMHTKPGIESVLRFLKETGIATRQWHLTTS